jgi:hypothetical protein
MTWLFAMAGLGALAAPSHTAAPEPTIVETRKLWDQAPHNAFTTLVRFGSRWYCAFREGSTHVSGDGVIRILTSLDGERWLPAAVLFYNGGDLRDPKFSVSPQGTLLLSAAVALNPPSEVRHRSVIYFSSDGRDWSQPVVVGDPNFWLWRIEWQRDYAYGVAYSTVDPRTTRLYASKDGVVWTILVENLYDAKRPSEAALLFGEQDTGYILLRRDGDSATAQLGTSRPPYRGWTWTDLGIRIGGPAVIRLPDGRVIAAGRFYEPVRTALAWLDVNGGSITEFLRLPSGGDTGYAGMVYHDGLLWISYYSSHGGKAAIYLAKVTIPPPGKPKDWTWMQKRSL